MSKNQDPSILARERAAFVEGARIMAGVEVEGVPALSIRAPWSWLVAKGIKTIENRDWGIQHIPTFRGRFLIHQTVNERQAETFAAMRLIRGRLPESEAGEIITSLPHGLSYGTAVIGEAELVAIYTKDELSGSMLAVGANDPDTVAKKTAFRSPWYVGNVALVLQGAKLWKRPVACKGQLGFFLPSVKQ